MSYRPSGRGSDDSRLVSDKFNGKWPVGGCLNPFPRATVVITNPTHVAVALEYKEGMQSPMVLAKGERVIAEKIKEMARKHNVPIVENPPLARALLKQCPIGAPISPDLFEAVAEVLAFVYRMNRRRTGSVSMGTK